MNRTLVAMYMTMLADVMSKHIGEPVVTDRPEYQGYGRWAAYAECAVAGPRTELEALLQLDIEFPSPEQLADVPISRIIAFCRKYKDEAMAFRQSIETKLQDLAQTHDPNALDRKMKETHDGVDKQLNDYRRVMRLAGFSLSPKVLTLTVPSLATAAITAVGHVTTAPLVAPLIGTAGIGITLFTIIVNALGDRKKTRDTYPYHYLLELKKLTS